MPEQKCRVCGCTHWEPCIDKDGSTCGWAEPNLCSACWMISTVTAFCAVWSHEDIVAQRLSSACGAARICAQEWLDRDSELSTRELVDKIHKAFGAPGDFGYGTDRGDILRRVYEGPQINNEPRVWTEDETREMFLRHVWAAVDDWTTNPRAGDVANRVSGVAFSILALLDGTNIGMPRFIVAPNPHPEDKSFCVARGLNWFALNSEECTEANFGGTLHEAFHKAEPKR